MKKRKNRIAVITIFVISILLVVVAVTLWRKKKQYPKDIDGDGFCQDYYVSADDCREFLIRHEVSLECFLETIKSQPTEDGYLIGFNNDGVLQIDDQLKYDETFIEALYEIYSDEIFQMNPYSRILIFWNKENGWRIDWRLFTNSSEWGGLQYRDVPKENYNIYCEQRLDDYWYWYSEGAI